MPTEEDIQEIADKCGDTLIEQVQTLAKRKGVEVSVKKILTAALSLVVAAKWQVQKIVILTALTAIV